MTGPSPLKLMAYDSSREGGYTLIRVFQNDRSVGILLIDTQHAAQVIRILNAGTDLLAAYEAASKAAYPCGRGEWMGCQFCKSPPNEHEAGCFMQLIEAAIAKAKPESAAAANEKDEP